MTDPGFELKVVATKFAGGAAGCIAFLIGYHFTNLCCDNPVIDFAGGLVLFVGAFTYADLVIRNMHIPLDNPPPKLYRLGDRKVMTEIAKVFDHNPFIDPIDQMPHDWKIKTWEDEGKIIFSIDFAEKSGIDFSYKEFQHKESIDKRHIKDTITVKQEDAGTSVSHEWYIVSPKRRDFANSVIRKYSDLIHEHLSQLEQSKS